MVAATVDARQAPASAPGRTVRRDIQGLRAVAVLLVLGFHAGVPGLGGGYVGVDVFFVISGFLITGLIVRELGRTGRLSLGRFYARRIRRLLPATAVTFVGVAVLTVVALPVTRWASIAGDIVASAAYVMNWRLADRSVDYLQAGAAASPLQHFWSLAVEEQFYIVWPLLIVALAWFARRRRGSGGPSALSTARLTLGLLAIGLPSLGWSIALTSSSPGPAYFVTTTRLWELVVGALLAVQVERAARAPLAVRATAGWLGLAAIGWSAVAFTAETRFPGTAALVPTLGSAAVLWAGSGDGRGRLRLLEPDPMQDVGALSYSLYLWHWPLIVVATAVWGRDDGTLWLPTALVVAGFSAVPAWLTYRLVEQPLHHHPAFGVPWRAAVLGLVCVAIGLASACMVQHSLSASADVTAIESSRPGAAVLAPVPQEAVIQQTATVLVPDPLAASNDRAALDGRRCIATMNAEEPVRCTFGPADAEVTVAVVGDSKMDQWLPALESIAREEGWRLETFLKSACPFFRGTVERDGGAFTSCQQLNARRVDEVLNDPSIDYVLTSQVSSRAWGAANPERAMVDGLEDTWRDLESRGKQVVVIADNPPPPNDIPECVLENRDRLGLCAFDADDRPTAQAQAARRADVPVIDLTPWICPGGQCPAVIGDVLVYRQTSHLSSTYVRTMAPYLASALAGVGLR